MKFLPKILFFNFSNISRWSKFWITIIYLQVGNLCLRLIKKILSFAQNREYVRNWTSKINVIIERRNIMAKTLFLIKTTQTVACKCEYKKNVAIEVDVRCLLIPGFRYDGVGIQAMIRICTMFLARQAKATYVHLPFFKLAHQNIDPTSRFITSHEWAKKWETFLNIGKDELHIGDLANSIGETRLAKYLMGKDRQFDDPTGVQKDILPKLVEKIRNNTVSGVYTFNIGLCRQPRECQLFFDSEFIHILQDRFNANGYKPEKLLFDKHFLNIALHIRRGDVWNAVQTGSMRKCYTNKFVSEDYYVELIQRLHKFFGSSSKPLRFHIFSDGKIDNFSHFTFIDESKALLKLESNIIIDNIRFHLSQNTFETLYHMIKAPIFVPGKSTFSVIALLLSQSYIIYDNEILSFYQYDLLEKYIEENPKIISLRILRDKVEDVLGTIKDSNLMI